jgi:hypothetical protein
MPTGTHHREIANHGRYTVMAGPGRHAAMAAPGRHRYTVMAAPGRYTVMAGPGRHRYTVMAAPGRHRYTVMAVPRLDRGIDPAISRGTALAGSSHLRPSQDGVNGAGMYRDSTSLRTRSHME